MKESEIFNELAGTMLQESIEVTIDVVASNAFHSWLIKQKICPAKRVFKVKPLCLGARALISREWASVPTYETSQDMIEINNDLSANHTEAMVNSIAIAFLNSPKKPSSRLKKFIYRSCTPSDVMRIFLVVRQQLDVSNFLSSIALARGASLLKPAEIIAAEKPKRPASTSTRGKSRAA